MPLTAPPRPLHICKLLTVTLLFTVLPGHAEPAAPDAGQTLRELQKLPDLTPPQPEPQLQIDQQLHIQEPPPEVRKSKPDDTRFMVKSVRINGNSSIPTGEFDALIAGLTGAEHDLNDLKAVAARITAYYRARGYPVARAYLPAQDIIDGAVSINVIEGRVAKRPIDNQSRLSDKNVNDFLGRIKEGDVVRTAPIDRTLRLLNDMPGVGGARASLQPGAGVGTSDLLVELKPGPAYSGNINLDNYGDRYIGAYRLGGTLHINSPFRIGDQISLAALASDQHLAFGRAAYQLPVGSDGLRLGAAYSDTRYSLGKEFLSLDAHGTAASNSVFAVYPFIRSQSVNVNGAFTWEQKNLADYVDTTSSVSEKHIRVANLDMSGNLVDALGGNTGFDLSVALGRLDIESPVALAIDEVTARTNGAYTRLSYAANRLQSLTVSNQLFLSISGQRASKNLDSSEQFSLGGANGVRAYPQGEGIGDQGYLVNLELRHNIGDTLQETLFYDTGSITVNRDPYGPPALNSRTLSGAGVGANASLAGTQFKVALAWRTEGGQPTSIPASAAHTPTVWFQASEQF